MTKENEKKEESRRAFSAYLSTTLNDRLKGLEKYTAYYESQLKEVDDLLKRAKELGLDDQETSLLVRKAILQTDIISSQDETITTYIMFNLFLKLIRLLREEYTQQPDASLELELEKAKKNLDDHLAKRLSQVFGDKNSKGYIG